MTALLASAQPRPNIIVMVADDLGYGDLSCYGAQRVSTPTVDSLAARGIRMTNMHACASTSTPSRYALLTGCYPFRKSGTDVAAGNAGMIITPTQTTVADLLKRAGYATAAIGKWHLGLGSATGRQDWNGQLDQSPQDLGFDYHYLMAATADRVPCVYVENGRVDNHDPAAPISVSYRSNFEGEPTGKTHPQLLTKLKPSHGHDQSIVNGISRIGYMKGGGKALWRDEDISDSIMAHAIRFIARHKAEPYFLYLCTNDVHVPRMPHERYRGKSVMGLRGEAIMQFDDAVRQLVSYLRQEGLDRNTLLILTSDNGPVLDDGYADEAIPLAGDHQPGGPWRGGKYSAFEAGSRVPCIVYWPEAVTKGKRQDALCSHIDLAANLAALVGVSTEGNEAPDSRNSLATWLGRSAKPRDYAVSMASNRSLSLTTQRYKYIPPSKGGPLITWGPRIETGYSPEPQLYDLKHDAQERHNMAGSKPHVLQRLRRIMETLTR